MSGVEHLCVTESYGDGYSEPRQETIRCSCDEVVYYEWIQHDNTCDEDCQCTEGSDLSTIANAHADHVLAVVRGDAS